MPQKLPEEAASRGRAIALSAECIERMARKHSGKPAHPNTKAALLAAAKRPKSIEHRKHLSAAHKARKKNAD